MDSKDDVIVCNFYFRHEYNFIYQMLKEDCFYNTLLEDN